MSKYLIISLTLLFAINCVIKDLEPDIDALSYKKIKKNPKYKEKCTIEEVCRRCTLEELKSVEECMSTGFKERKLCVLYDGERIVTDYYKIEICEASGINSVYILLVICLITGGLSLYIRKYHRRMLLQHALEKITILKDK